MSTLPQQPSIIEILSNSFRLYLKSFPKWIGYSLIALPISVIPMIGFFVPFLIQAPLVYRVDNVVNKRDDNFVQPLSLAVKKLPAMLSGALLLFGILIIVAMILGVVMFGILNSNARSMNDLWGAIGLGIEFGIIGFIVLSTSYLLFGYFILFENLNSYQSLIASYRLVRGHWWRTFLVFFILMVFIYFLVLLSFIFPSISLFSFFILHVFVIPYFFILGYLQYHDLKLRKNNT